MIKSLVTRKEEATYAFTIVIGKSEGKIDLEDLGVEGV
jgi:hypothetical protein